MHHQGFDVDVVTSRASRARSALIGLIAALAFVAVGAATASAATLNVATTGADTGDCVADPCLTIQYAVDQATAGDTIDVAAGTYSEDVVIDKQLNLRGAQAGVDARDRTGAETVVQAANPGAGRNVTLSPRADGITIDGFTITQDAAQTANGIGIEVPLDVSTRDLTVANNIVSGNQYGMAGFTPAPTADIGGLLVERNLFTGNNVDGDAPPTTTAMFLLSRPADGVTITENAFEDTFAPGGDGAAINISGTVADPMNGFELTDNSSDDDQTFLVHYNAAGSLIDGNRIANQTGTSVYIGGNTDGITISDNEITDGATAGIRLTDVFGTTAPTNVAITGNTIGGMGGSGIRTEGATPSSGLTITGNQISGNHIGVENAQAAPITVGAGNTFTGNDANTSGYVLGVAPRTLYVAADGDDAGNGCVFEDAPCLTVQRAVAQAAPGDTIEVGAGTFGAPSAAATVSVNKADLTISGVDAEQTVIEAPEGPTGAAAFELGENGDDLTLQDLSIDSPDGDLSVDRRGIRTGAGPVTVEGLTLNGVVVTGFRYGLETPSVASAQQATLTGTTINQSLFAENEYAAWFGGKTTGLDVTDSVFIQNDFGIQAYPPDPNPSFQPGVFDDVSITGTMFAATAKKAIYLEAANDLLIDGVTVIETGTQPPVNPPAYRPPFDGIDINAKYGDFSGITISDTEASGTAVNPDRPLAVQGGISIKSRNDGPTYGAHPASISDVAVTNVIADDNENGLVLGGALDGVTVDGGLFSDNAYAGIALVRETAGTGSTITDLAVTGTSFDSNGAGIATNTGSDPTAVAGLDVRRNAFTGNDAGIRIGAAGVTGAGQSIAGNSFTGNDTGIRNQSGTGVNAENNWWGCGNGPGGAGCDNTAGAVDSFPFIVFSATADSASVNPGGTVRVTAGFNRNNNGQPVDGSVLDGHAVSFAATNGSVDPATANLGGGSAATTFTPSGALGPATVTATADGQTAEAVIQVDATAPTVTAPGLSGSGRVGEPLTCTPGQGGGQPAPAVTTEFLADGAVIPGQSGLSYTPVEGDVGKAITCRSTATNPAGNASASSQPITVTAVPVEPAKPPVVTPVKKEATVPASGKVVVTTIKCPEGTCQVNAPKTIKVKIGGKTYTATVKVQRKVGEGKSAKVTIVLPKAARKAIKGKKGRAKLKVTVTSSDGKKKTITQTIRLKGGKG